MLKRVVAVFAAFALSASPAVACKKDDHSPRKDHSRSASSWTRLLFGGATGSQPVGTADGSPSIAAYEGVGAWVDLFDEGPWTRPGSLIARLAKRDVKTIYIQTSSYGQPEPVMHRRVQAQILQQAHARGMKVVAWYVPDFTDPERDLRRTMAAVRFRAGSHRFDSVGIDIEATHVGDIALRNSRLLRLAREVRASSPSGYPIGAITPDPKASLYWPSFPWRQVARSFDVIVPMGYFTFQADGYRAVRRYTEHGLRLIKRATEDRDVPIHWIGGISDDTDGPEVRAFVRAARKLDAIGASLYDAPISGPEDWRALRLFDHPRPPKPAAPAEEPEPKEKKREPQPPKHQAPGKKDERDDDRPGDRPGRKEREKPSASGKGKGAAKGKGPGKAAGKDAGRKKPDRGADARGRGFLRRALDLVP